MSDEYNDNCEHCRRRRDNFVEHEWHEHPEAKAWLVGALLIGLAVMGIAWFAWYSGTNWRTTHGNIASEPYKYQFTTIVCTSTGKSTICFPVVNYHSKFNVTWIWSIQRNSTSLILNQTQYVDVNGWNWVFAQNVTMTVDKNTGGLIYCCN